MLRKVKNQTGLDNNTYETMYPMSCSTPKFYGLPKIHNPDIPLKPIVSSHGSVTYGVVRHIHSIQDFVEQANKVTLLPGECLSSYDVTALFTLDPIDPALGIIKDLLEKSNTLKEGTVLPVKDKVLLLEFCLKNDSFSFQGQFYEHVEGAAMGSSVSPIVANLYMEYFEQKAPSTATHSQNMAQVCG